MADMIEGIRIESYEDGFHLILEGDFVRACERYLSRGDCTIDLCLPQDAALKLADNECAQIRLWRQEGFAAAASHVPPVDPGDCGYEPNDPKHPAFHQRFSAQAEELRKREREQ